MEKRALGKGLDAIIQENFSEENKKSWVTSIPLDKIVPFSLQPRKEFSEEEIEMLSNSIKEKGLLQPLVVRRKEDIFELIAGERRMRASKKAGLQVVPAVVIDVSDEEALQVSLIENIQRTDLNPVEEASAYKKLQDKFNLSQQEIADRVSKNRSTVANYLRLFALPSEVLGMLKKGDITFGHAKVLLGINGREAQIETGQRIWKEKLSVRQVEGLVFKETPKKNNVPDFKTKKSPELIDIENKMTKVLGTKVLIKNRGKKGKISIDYYSNKDLERILSIIVN
jgi:ParB family chromosome partitioning protein